MTAVRDERGRFVPGSSGNANGRPRAGTALAERIRERMSPDTILDLATKVAEDETMPPEKRLAVLLPLATLGYTKPATTIELDKPSAEPELDLSKLTDDELRTWIALSEKCAVQRGDGSDTRTLSAETEIDSQSSASNAVDCTTEHDRAAR